MVFISVLPGFSTTDKVRFFAIVAHRLLDICCLYSYTRSKLRYGRTSTKVRAGYYFFAASMAMNRGAEFNTKFTTACIYLSDKPVLIVSKFNT
jgi:hypothetical protein